MTKNLNSLAEFFYFKGRKKQHRCKYIDKKYQFSFQFLQKAWKLLSGRNFSNQEIQFQILLGQIYFLILYTQQNLKANFNLFSRQWRLGFFLSKIFQNPQYKNVMIIFTYFLYTAICFHAIKSSQHTYNNFCF